MIKISEPAFSLEIPIIWTSLSSILADGSLFFFFDGFLVDWSRSDSGIFLIGQDENPNYGTFVYIYIYIGKFDNRQYSDLREYVEKSGFGHTQNTIGIPSIEEITNQNDIKIYKVSVLDFLSKNQYVSFAINYNKNDKNYIGIKNAGSNEIGQQLLSSFHFID